MVKIVVSKERYDYVRYLEKITGKKIHCPKCKLHVSDCINGQWGVYRLKRCFRSGLHYIADMELVYPTANHKEAVHFMKLMKRKTKKRQK